MNEAICHYNEIVCPFTHARIHVGNSLPPKAASGHNKNILNGICICMRSNLSQNVADMRRECVNSAAPCL